MNLQENGPLQKAKFQFNDASLQGKWQISTSVFIGILPLAISAGAICYMIWDNYNQSVYKMH